MEARCILALAFQFGLHLGIDLVETRKLLKAPGLQTKPTCMLSSWLSIRGVLSIAWLVNFQLRARFSASSTVDFGCPKVDCTGLL